MKMTDPGKPLTELQRRFVAAYFTCNYNATEAASLAGYNGNVKQIGHELKNKPHVAAAIGVEAKKRIEKISLTEDYVLRKLVRTIEKAEEDNNLTAVLRGIELAARNLGMLRDKTEITGKDGEAIKYEEIKNEADEFTRRVLSLSKRPELKVVGD